MKLKKRQAFFAILAVWLLLCLLYQFIWIFSGTATAEVYAADASSGRGWGSRRNSGIKFMHASYHAANTVYLGTYLKNDKAVQDHYFEIRYLLFAPGISRSNTFASNWGPLIMIFIVLTLITGIVYIRKDIVADQAIFVVQAQRPFVKIENNQIEDYDQHDMEKSSPDEAEQALKKRLRTEPDLFQMKEISASVYKFNPNAIAIFVGYVFLFFWAFYLLLNGSLGYPGILSLGAVLLFIPLFVQNTNNPIFKAKIPDQGCLVFSSHGVQFEDEFYAVEDIDAAVLYLESFRGFEYRERVTTGSTVTTSSGDNNKISYRCKGQMVDFTFILDHLSDYWSLQNLMTDWRAKGVNVLLEKVFEDDFLIQEMVKFDTPVAPGSGS
jgi:hypothetical protein